MKLIKEMSIENMIVHKRILQGAQQVSIFWLSPINMHKRKRQKEEIAASKELRASTHTT